MHVFEVKEYTDAIFMYMFCDYNDIQHNYSDRINIYTVFGIALQKKMYNDTTTTGLEHQ